MFAVVLKPQVPDKLASGADGDRQFVSPKCDVLRHAIFTPPLRHAPREDEYFDR